MTKRKTKYLVAALLVCLLVASASIPIFANSGGAGNVAQAVESTWKEASGQIKTVVNKVVFPCIDLILAVFFFAKLGTAYFDCASVKAI